LLPIATSTIENFLLLSLTVETKPCFVFGKFPNFIIVTVTQVIFPSPYLFNIIVFLIGSPNSTLSICITSLLNLHHSHNKRMLCR